MLSTAVLGATLLTAGSAEAFVWPNVPERVARALDSSDASERRLAAERLTDLPKELALPLVRKAMADPDVEVRLRAAQAAITFRLPKAGDLVIPWLSESDSRLRLAAADVVQAAPTDRAVVALGRVLADPSEDVRFATAVAMGASGSADAVSPLLGHLDDSSPEVRAEVARALGRIGDARAVVPLVGKVQDSSAIVRRSVARALGELEDDRAASALMLSLQDSSEDVRVEAVTALGRIRSRDATLAIGELVLTDDSTPATSPGSSARRERVRRAALRSLGRIASADAVGVLVKALAADDGTRGAAAVRDALVTAGNAAVAPLASELGRTSNPQVAASAALVLGELGATASVNAIIRAMRRGSLPLRPGLQALGRLGDPAALALALELIDDADPGVRREAIDTASALLDPKDPDGRAVDPVISVLSDAATSLDERTRLVRLLGRTGAPRAQQVLLQLAGDESVVMRQAVLQALGNLSQGSEEVDAELLDALGDESALVRRHAALALSKVATGGAASTLLNRLTVSAEQDRGAIGIALSGALSRVEDDAVAESAGAALRAAPASARDSLIEGLGRMATPAAGKELAKLARGTIDDRRKVAEALAGHPAELSTLEQLLADPDTTVRANAVWSVGATGTAAQHATLAALVTDPDAAVAGNAAAAVGRLGARVGGKDGATKVAEVLCPALADTRPYVRANAIAGLDVANAACEADAVHERLARDRSEAVRLSAARYLRARAADEKNRRALVRCVADDKNATVAGACEADHEMLEGSDSVVVFVVPDGRNSPLARAPYALVRPDGLMRLGVADRRGALFEQDAPRGTIRLAVPAPLAR